MIELERETVGKKLSRKFIHEVAQTTALPFDVCAGLLEAGWTLEVERNRPATWVQPWPTKTELDDFWRSELTLENLEGQ